ncbi:MAG: hypothetical protein RLZZ127_2208 [Planctomycetota bacterium]
MSGAWIVPWIAGILAHSLWLAAVVAVAVRFVGRGGPAARHGWALAGLAALLMALVGIGIWTWPTAAAAVAVAGAAASPAAGAIATAPGPAALVVAPAPLSGWDPAPWLVGAWACGVVVMALRQVAGTLRWRRLRRSAIPLPGALLQAVAGCAARVGIPVPRTGLVRGIPSPVVLGLWRPVLLWPAAMASGWTPAQVEALILHELHHIRRRDAWIEPVVAAVEGLLFFHPAVWWLAREVRESREACCDQDAVAQGAGPRTLAGALLRLAEAADPSPALAASGGALERRVRSLLGRPAAPTGVRLVVAGAALPLAVLALTACVRAGGPPPEWERGPFGPVPVLIAIPQADLVRRIAARNDGTVIELRIRFVDGDPATLPGGGPATLHAPPAGTGMTVTLSGHPLEPVRVVGHRPLNHLYGYGSVAGEPDPLIRSTVPEYAIDAVLDHDRAGTPILAGLRLSWTEVAGLESSDIQAAVRGATRALPMEIPAGIVFAAEMIGRDLSLAEDRPLRVPLAAHPVRGWDADGDGLVRVPGSAEVASSRYALLTARIRPSVDRSRIGFEGDVTWHETTRVSLDVRDRPLAEVLAVLAPQLPVPILVGERIEADATRVTLTARAEPLAAVLPRLSAQILPLMFVKAHGMEFTMGQFYTDIPLRSLPWSGAQGPSQQRTYDASRLLFEPEKISPEARRSQIDALIGQIADGIAPGLWDARRGLLAGPGPAQITVIAPVGIHGLVRLRHPSIVPEEDAP